MTCAQCTDLQIFYATGIIRFRHNRTMSGSGVTTFTFNNFPTSSYTILNQNVNVNV